MKKLLAVILSLCMVLGMGVAAMAADPKAFDIVNVGRINSTEKYIQNNKSLDEIIKIINGTAGLPYRIFGSGANLDTTSPIVIGFNDEWGNYPTVGIDKDFTVENRIYRFCFATANNKYGYTQGVNITGKFTVSNGGILVLSSDSDVVSTFLGGGKSKITVSNPIEVNEGGTLYIESNINGPDEVDEYISEAPDQPIIEVNGGTVHLGASKFTMPEGSTTAPIVLNGGMTIIHEKEAKFDYDHAYYQYLIPDYSALDPTSQMHRRDNMNIKIETDNIPAIEVKSGATLTLMGGELHSVNSPAITVASGATIEIPKETVAVVTTDNADTQAIALEGGAVIEKDGLTVTVSTENAAAGDNYVDNYGNIVLAKGAKADGTDMNAAVILPDGTVIEGSKDEAPTFAVDETSGETKVTVPAGGSVKKPGEDKVDMPAGGAVTATETATNLEVNPAPVDPVDPTPTKPEKPAYVPVRDTVTVEIGGEKEEAPKPGKEENPNTGAPALISVAMAAAVSLGVAALSKKK